MLTKSARAEPDRPEASAASLGQRERNKRDKLLRIKNTARALFISKGYDDTTTREIAIRAGVGMGTVFTYADNKRDLLFLIANDDLEATTRRSEAEVSPTASLIANLIAIFRNQYKFFAQQPELSRLTLREMLFYDSGQQANRFKLTREKLISLLSDVVNMAKSDKKIATDVDSREIAWMLFCIYQVELRRWLAGDALNLERGMEQLGKLLQIALTGVAPKSDAVELRKTGKLRNVGRPALKPRY